MNILQIFSVKDIVGLYGLAILIDHSEVKNHKFPFAFAQKPLPISRRYYIRRNGKWYPREAEAA